MYQFLNVQRPDSIFLFDFSLFTKRVCIKIIVEAAKEDSHERSSVPTFFMEQSVQSNFKMYSLLILVFLFLFTTIHPKCFCKSCLFLKFQAPHERASDISLFVEHPVFSSLKMYSVLILLFLFIFATFHSKHFCRSHFFCYAKGAVILLYS